MFSQCKEGTACPSGAQLSVWKCRTLLYHTAQEHTFHPYYTPREHTLGVLKQEVLSSMEMEKRQGVSLFISGKYKIRSLKQGCLYTVQWFSTVSAQAYEHCSSGQHFTSLGFFSLIFKGLPIFLAVAHRLNRTGYKD